MSTTTATPSAAAEATHIRLADRLRELLYEFNMSGGALPGFYENDNTHVVESEGFYAAKPWALVQQALRLSLTGLVGSSERAEELYDSLIDNGEDVAFNLRVMRDKWANDALEQHLQMADSLIGTLLTLDKSDVELVGDYYLTDDRGELSPHAHVRAALLKSALALTEGRLDRAEALIEDAMTHECDISELIYDARLKWAREDREN
ncbi:hypothetical protein ALI22I_33880 [Saccharothrix sp. ALI-22-I]|uniref:hypothetical protein n=1 Tax=Saccharothrix sp. ALI-22-I TaxID=1933778 RepID=UPI00097C34A6|nr:hypothetical protein [Saccharothrix sp. ALI-22-I]ONI83486.1 hypothetical protein ALI22I_33880 [Saccharothrix sp. ALI-22-I]